VAKIIVDEFEILIDDSFYPHLKDYKWGILKRNNLRHAYRRKNNRNLYMHHEILPIKKGQCIDHINGNGLDNRLENLRIATKMENGRNRGKTKRNTSGYKGVSLKKDCKRSKPYRATIVVNRKQIFLGNYKTAKEAAKAYNLAARMFHGNFAKLNEV
jgi:hypothetical protein